MQNIRNVPVRELLNDAIQLDRIGYPSGYFITKCGKVLSLKSGTPYELNTHISAVGYPAVGLKHNRKTKLAYVHRLIALAFIDNPENKPQINHIDGDKANNDIENLEWVSASENVQHAWDNKLNRKTEKTAAVAKWAALKMMVARRRFSDAEVEDIRQKISEGWSYRSIARDFGCNHSLISQIATGNAYCETLAELADKIDRLQNET